MSDRCYQPFFWGDYNQKTKHLSLHQHGAYLLLIGHYWSTGKSFKKNDAWRIAGAYTQAEQEAVTEVIEEFFEVKDGLCINSRIEEDLKSNKDQADKRKERAKNAADKRWNNAQSNATSMPQASSKQSSSNAPAMPSTSTITSISNTNIKKEGIVDQKNLSDPLFKEFYKNYPRKIAPKEAEKAWKKLTSEEKSSAVSAVQTSAFQDFMASKKDKSGDFRPHPATWLNQGRWDDDVFETGKKSQMQEMKEAIEEGF